MPHPQHYDGMRRIQDVRDTGNVADRLEPYGCFR
jgi:hypothetical protein